MKTPLAKLLQKITPLPVEFKRENDGAIAFRLAANRLIIADVFHNIGGNHAPSKDEAIANAEYLSHAANTLPALVAAARDACGDHREHDAPCNCTECALFYALAAAENVNTKDE